ncbi:hypothetical protein [Streptomyces sp. NPDC051572]|uniref:hypothetical protein n=1 Tax=Streptomyces sp. NPDC051572 TaxID=3155802 RepID=UPI00344D8090
MRRRLGPAFPARWRRRVLAWIAGVPADADDLPARALDAAARRGITFEELSAPQRAYWLTPAEHALDRDERMQLLLVRSARTDASATIWPAGRAEAHDLLPPDDTPATTVAAAWQLNQAIGRSAPHRSVHHLREDLLRGHLAQQWGTDPGDHHALTTAAFDRAFPSLDAALEAARPFYLHTCGARRLLDRERQPSAA